VRINGAPRPRFLAGPVRTTTSLRRRKRLLQQIPATRALLLDIVSELDETRRSSVLASITDFDQVWFGHG
jgi:hypothetical protein